MKTSFLTVAVSVGVALTPCASFPVIAQGIDTAFNARVGRPAYVRQHPRVLFDEAHNNADTSTGRYKPFADLIRSDGYTVVPATKTFSAVSLRRANILVIVNASGPSTNRSAPAFSEQESNSVRAWVSAGGCLLVIADQAPYSSAVEGLLKRFDVEITKGFTIDSVYHNKDSGDETELAFNRENGLLGDHPITQGRDATERLNRIITFTGTSVKGPAGGVSFLKLSDSAKDVFPSDRKAAAPEEATPDPKLVSAAGRAQGVAMTFGKGRVVVLGDAAMLTAQVALKGFSFGMNLPGIDNRQLALNVMHWLSGLLK